VDSVKYYLIQSEAYEHARKALDVLFGYPDALTTTCVLPADQCRHHEDGRIICGLPESLHSHPQVAAALLAMADAGTLAEIPEPAPVPFAVL
jgi:hypothetical protein